MKSKIPLTNSIYFANLILLATANQVRNDVTAILRETLLSPSISDCTINVILEESIHQSRGQEPNKTSNDDDWPNYQDVLEKVFFCMFMKRLVTVTLILVFFSA